MTRGENKEVSYASDFLKDFDIESQVIHNFASILALVSNNDYDCDELNEQLDELKSRLDEQRSFYQQLITFNIFLNQFKIRSEVVPQEQPVNVYERTNYSPKNEVSYFTKIECDAIPNYLGRHTLKNLNEFVDTFNGFLRNKRQSIKQGKISIQNKKTKVSAETSLTEIEICKYLRKPQLDKKLINLLVIMKKFNKIGETKENDIKKYFII